MSSIFGWARHADEIEDAREVGGETLIERALAWAVSSKAMELAEYHAALSGLFAGRGNCPADAAAVNRALEIILDAYLEDMRRAA